MAKLQGNGCGRPRVIAGTAANVNGRKPDRRETWLRRALPMPAPNSSISELHATSRDDWLCQSLRRSFPVSWRSPLTAAVRCGAESPSPTCAAPGKGRANRSFWRRQRASCRDRGEEPELRSVPFTLTIDKQDGRRFSGTFSSARGGSKVVAVMSRSGTIFLADAEGFSNGTMLAPDRMELCYLKHAPDARIASCVELTKQP